MSKQEQIEKLNSKMTICDKCALKKGCKNVVAGEGSAEAEIMFVGEAPGAKEDELGRPFVGASGKFLDEMLKTIKLERKDVYITNIAKCRPPDNRDPLPEEIAVCWPWLVGQIKIIKPLLIVTLGRHSMMKFLPGKKISEVHGQATSREVEGIGRQTFFVLYHPAVALYNGGMRKVLIKDFKRIPKVLDKIKSAK